MQEESLALKLFLEDLISRERRRKEEKTLPLAPTITVVPIGAVAPAGWIEMADTKRHFRLLGLLLRRRESESQ